MAKAKQCGATTKKGLRCKNPGNPDTAGLCGVHSKGLKNESALLRKLVDEALDARRRKSQSAPLTEKSDCATVRLEAIETLLMRLVQEEDVSFRIHDVCLVLLQDILTETYATRRLLWESVVLPQLRAAGVDVNELDSRFALAEDQARYHAYGLAERIRQSQETETG